MKKKSYFFFVPQMSFCLKIISVKWKQVQKQFSHKKTYIFFEKLLFTRISSLIYILNNFFSQHFLPNELLWLVQEIYNWQEFWVCNQYHDSHVFRLQYIHFIVQLGSVRKCLKVLYKFFGICPPVFPPVITATAFLPYSFPSSGSKYRFSSPMFGVHTSVYTWYPQTNELIENWWSFSTIMLIFHQCFLTKSQISTCLSFIKANHEFWIFYNQKQNRT